MSERETPSNEFTASPPSGSSSSPLQRPWWQAPERILAVAAAALLRWKGMLSEEWTATILMVALGAPVTQVAIEALKRRRLKGDK